MTKGSDRSATNDFANGGRRPRSRDWIRPRGQTWYRPLPRPPGDAEHPGDPPRHRRIAAGRVAQATVFDPCGRRLGRIAEIAIDEATAEVVFVLVAEGGFLGFGERLRRASWSSLSYDATRRGYVLDVRRMGEEARAFAESVFQSAGDRGRRAAGG